MYQSNDQQKVRQATSNRPAIDQQSTTNKNEKNDKNEKKVVGDTPEPPATTELTIVQKEPTPANTLAEFLEQAKARSGTLYEKSVGYFAGKGIANPPSEIAKFCNYWTERTADGKRQRWQKEKVFELSRRLATWATRAANDRGNGKPKEQWQAIEDVAAMAAIKSAFKPQNHV